MVEEACAYVQGESLKAYAAFLVSAFQLPDHQGGRMRQFLFAIASCAMLSGCAHAQDAPAGGGVPLPPAQLTNGMQQAAETAVGGKLKDPYSAHYKDFRAYQQDSSTFIICGTVNAKNSYGGYVGDVPFIAYVASGVGQKAGQYFPIGANIAPPDDISAFYQVVPLCQP